MPLRKFAAQVAVKLGSGVQTPVAADCLAVVNAGYEHNVELFNREDITGNFMKFTGIPGQRMGRITFSVYLKGSGTAGTAPEFGDALRACRLNETIVAVTSVTYKPLIAESQVASVQYNLDGTAFKIQDAIGNVEFVCEKPGNPWVANFTFQGLMVDPVDLALLSPTYDSTIPPAMLGSTVTLNGVTTDIVGAFGFKLGNDVIMRDSIAAASGFAGAFNSNRRTMGSFKIECPTIAGDNIFSKLKTPTEGVFQHSAIGSAGNLVQLLANVGSYTSLSVADENGLGIINGEFLCGRAGATAEGDDFKIIFT